MIAVDTHVLVQLLVNDHAAQAARARDLVDAQALDDGSIWVSDTVPVEIVWILSRAYDQSRSAFILALRASAAHATMALESPLAVRAAIDAFEAGAADFANCLLAEKAQRARCEQLFILDNGMRGLTGVKLLLPNSKGCAGWLETETA